MPSTYAASSAHPSLAKREIWLSRAILGGLLWGVGMLAIAPPLEVALLALAPLVLVPLALRLVAPPSGDGLQQKLYRGVSRLQLPAAVLLLLAFALPVGASRGAMILPWLVVTLFLALWGMLRTVQQCWTLPQLAFNAALLFIAVGGMWTAFAGWGWSPVEFEPIIVLLTGVHFHYAGFGLPVILAQQAETLPGRTVRITFALVLLGIPLLALGITFSPTLEVAAASVLVIGSSLVAANQLRMACSAHTPAELMLFASSGMALLGGMSLAMLYAVGEFTGRAWIDIPTMIPLHGLANGVGFVLLGLLAWNLHRFRAN